jgi:hypothetical protein
VFATDEHWRPLHCVKAVKIYLGIMREATELDLTLSSLLVKTSCYTWDCHLSDVLD